MPRLFERRILPVVNKFCNEIISNHLGLETIRTEAWIYEKINEKVWQIYSSCSDQKKLSGLSGRSFFYAMLSPTSKYENIADDLNAGLYDEEIPRNTLSKGNVKKHVYDAIANIKECMRNEIYKINWHIIIKKKK